MKVEVHKNLIFDTISQINSLDIQIGDSLAKVRSVDLAEWSRHLPDM